MSKEYEAPLGSVERVLADIWREVLLTNRVGRHDNFFVLGGRSFASMRLIARVSEAFSVQISVDALLEYPTLRELAQLIGILSSSDVASGDVPLTRRASGDAAPLTPIQQLAFNSGLSVDAPHPRFCAFAVVIQGHLRADILATCISEVVARHESLRTRFVRIEGEVRQIIDEPGERHFDVVNLEALIALSEQDVQDSVNRFIREDITLNAGPLFSTRLLRLSSDKHILVYSLDHLVADGASYEIVNREIWTLYAFRVQGKPFELPPLEVQLADYSVWLRETEARWIERSAAYWKSRLARAPRADLPVDLHNATAAKPEGATLRIPFGESLTTELSDTCRQQGVFSALAMLAVYAALLSRWCGQNELLITFADNGRFRRELEQMVGWLSDTLILRIELDRAETFLDLLKLITEEYRAAYQHRSFNRVLELVPAAQLNFCFNWLPGEERHRQSIEDSDGRGEVRVEPYPIEWTSVPPFYFSIFFSSSITEVVATIAYRPDLFTSRTVEEVAFNLLSFTQKFLRKPQTRISSMAFVRASQYAV